MDAIFMNSKNSKTSKQNVLILRLSDKIDLRTGNKNIALSNLNIYYTWKNIKSIYNNNNLKYLHLHRVKNLNYQLDHILY